MKKLSLFLVLGFCGVLHASDDMFQSMRPAVWRSSRTASADNFVLVATGAIHFRGVIIGSASAPGGDGFVSIFNATTTNTALFSFTTAAFINTSLNDANDPYDMYLSSGLVYQKRGLADVNILWDYETPYNSKIVPFQP